MLENPGDPDQLLSGRQGLPSVPVGKATPAGEKSCPSGAEEGKRRRIRSKKLDSSDFLVDDEDGNVDEDGEKVHAEGGPVATSSVLPPARQRVLIHSDVAGDIQKALEENERAEVDYKDISDLLVEISKAKELTSAWEGMLAAKTKNLEDLHEQNSALKRLFSSLSVVKDDFIEMDGVSDEEKRAKMLGIGQRMVDVLRKGEDPEPVKLENDKQTSVPKKKREKATIKVNEECSDAPAQYIHPIEGQIAAAALLAGKGDPARALVSLVEKGLRARRNACDD